MDDQTKAKCNRCGNMMKPEEATRDRRKAGYVHRDEEKCEKKRKGK